MAALDVHRLTTRLGVCVLSFLTVQAAAVHCIGKVAKFTGSYFGMYTKQTLNDLEGMLTFFDDDVRKNVVLALEEVVGAVFAAHPPIDRGDGTFVLQHHTVEILARVSLTLCGTMRTDGVKEVRDCALSPLTSSPLRWPGSGCNSSLWCVCRLLRAAATHLPPGLECSAWLHWSRPCTSSSCPCDSCSRAARCAGRRAMKKICARDARCGGGRLSAWLRAGVQACQRPESDDEGDMVEHDATVMQTVVEFVALLARTLGEGFQEYFAVVCGTGANRGRARAVA